MRFEEDLVAKDSSVAKILEFKDDVSRQSLHALLFACQHNTCVTD